MPPSSNAFVPSTVGLICASYVVNDILKDIPVRRIKDKGNINKTYGRDERSIVIFSIGFISFMI